MLASFEDILHKNLYEFLHPDSYDKVAETIKQGYWENQEVTQLVEQKMIKSDGEIIDVSVMGVPYYLNDRIVAQVIIQDITNRKKLRIF